VNSQKFAIWTFRKSLTYASGLATATQVQNKRRQHYSIINADSLTPVMQQYLHKVLKQKDVASFAHSCKGQVHVELSLNKHQKIVEPSNPVTIHPYGCHLSNPTLSKTVSVKIQKYSTNTRGRAVGDYCVILKSDCGQIPMQWQGLHQ
jgi:hypothetical protein